MNRNPLTNRSTIATILAARPQLTQQSNPWQTTANRNLFSGPKGDCLMTLTQRVSAALTALLVAAMMTVPGTVLAQSTAPQILALVAMNDPLTMRCQAGDCAVELSSFCLQQERPVPRAGTKYDLAGGKLHLRGETWDGEKVLLDAGRHLSIVSYRTHVAVKVSVPVEFMLERNLKYLTVAVDRDVTLIAAAKPGQEVIAGAEKQIVTKILRKVGTRVIDQDRNIMSAVRMTNRIAHALPRGGHVNDAEVKAVWRNQSQTRQWRAMPVAAALVVKSNYQRCHETTSLGSLETMRQCMSASHDIMLGNINKAYWKAVLTGS